MSATSMGAKRLAILATVVASVALGASSASASFMHSGAIVVVGVPALRWQDVTATGTPTLWRIADQGALGALSVRATADLPHQETAPADGWVTLGAGNRATGRPAGAKSDSIPVLPAAVESLRAANRSFPYDARFGALGTSLRRGLVNRVAFGPGAALALADDTGQVEASYPTPAGLVDFEARFASAAQPGTVVAVELPDLVAGTTATALKAVDDALAAIERGLTRDDTLLVVGLADRPGEPAQLRVAIASGVGFARGGLASATTRREGYVQLLDVGPTILRLRGLDPNKDMAGRPWQSSPPDRSASSDASVEPIAARASTLVEQARAAEGYRRYAAAFFVVMGLAQVLAYALAFLVLRGVLAHRTRALSALRAVALTFAAMPAATYLAHLSPWWRYPLAFLIAVVSALSLGITAVALRGPWRVRPLGPEGFVAGTTFAVIGLDLLTGARLQLSSVAGYSPVVAGRFAGIGNVAFAVFATGALLLAAAWCVGAPPRRRGPLVAAVGVLAIVIDGSPTWGSDFGGVLALVPAFAVVAMLVSGRRLSWLRLLVIGTVAVLVVAAFALLDYARLPQDQTHLGRFVGQILDGGAGTVVSRKAAANVALLTRSPVTFVVPVVLAMFALALLRPAGALRRTLTALPALRSGLIGVLVLSVVGLVVNDSGIAVPALALSIAVPLTVAASMRYADAPVGAPAEEE